MKKIIIIFILLFTSYHLNAQTELNKEKRFNAELESIIASIESGQLSKLEGAREATMAAKAYYPNDTLLIGYFESNLNYAERLERKEITLEKAQELRELRLKRYKESIIARAEELKQLQIAQERDANERRLKQDSERAYQQYLAEQEANEARNRAAMSTMINGIGNAFRNAYGNNGTNCVTNRYGNQSFTNCR